MDLGPSHERAKIEPWRGRRLDYGQLKLSRGDVNSSSFSVIELSELLDVRMN